MILRVNYLRVLACVAALVFFGQYCVHGKVFTRCQLAKELLNQGFPKEDLREWVCLVEEVSECNTKRIEGPHKDDTVDIGLFQINSYFCRDHRPGGECKVLCGSLLSDNITKASRCAMYIYEYYGFDVWEKFFEKCIYYVPNLQPCGIYY